MSLNGLTRMRRQCFIHMLACKDLSLEHDNGNFPSMALRIYSKLTFICIALQKSGPQLKRLLLFCENSGPCILMAHKHSVITRILSSKGSGQCIHGMRKSLYSIQKTLVYLTGYGWNVHTVQIPALY